jgi:hypothetical protein
MPVALRISGTSSLKGKSGTSCCPSPPSFTSSKNLILLLNSAIVWGSCSGQTRLIHVGKSGSIQGQVDGVGSRQSTSSKRDRGVTYFAPGPLLRATETYRIPPYKRSPYKGRILVSDILGRRRPIGFVREPYPIRSGTLKVTGQLRDRPPPLIGYNVVGRTSMSLALFWVLRNAVDCAPSCLPEISPVLPCLRSLPSG